MGCWNHRVIKKKYKGTKQYYYEIHEVYYDEDGKIYGWTENACEVYGESLQDLKNGYKQMESAFKLPILVEKGKRLVEEK